MNALFKGIEEKSESFYGMNFILRQIRFGHYTKLFLVTLLIITTSFIIFRRIKKGQSTTQVYHIMPLIFKISQYVNHLLLICTLTDEEYPEFLQNCRGGIRELIIE